MNESEFQQLASLRRPLTAAEQARVAAHLAACPEAHVEWEVEHNLNHLLARLPDAPLASNFTAQVLSALDREEQATARGRAGLDWRRWTQSWLPRFALTGLVACAGTLLVYQHHQSEREQMVKVLVEIAAVPDAEALQDFDVIQRLSQVSAQPDDALLNALQ